jgi:hypothetical protein
MQPALIDHLAVVHAHPGDRRGPSAWHRGHVEVVDAMEVCERQGEALPCLGADESVAVKRMNGLIACLMAITVAPWPPASGETRGEGFSHDAPLLRHTDVHAAAGNHAVSPRAASSGIGP